MITALLGRNGRVLILILGAILIQGPVLDRLQVARAHPDLFLLLPVIAGLVAGPGEGAWVGFLAGLAADVPLPTAFGLSALVFTLTGFAVGTIVQTLLEGPWWVVPLTGAVGTAIGEFLYVGIATVTNQTLVLRDPRAVAYIVGVAAMANAFLALPVAFAMRWAVEDDVKVAGLA
ncbi:MAG: rod shape-determining protein MreD [Acidimicrobiales bacterium]